MKKPNYFTRIFGINIGSNAFPLLELSEALYRGSTGSADPLDPVTALIYYEFLSYRLKNWRSFPNDKFSEGVKIIVKSAVDFYESESLSYDREYIEKSINEGTFDYEVQTAFELCFNDEYLLSKAFNECINLPEIFDD